MGGIHGRQQGFYREIGSSEQEMEGLEAEIVVTFLLKLLSERRSDTGCHQLVSQVMFLFYFVRKGLVP